MYLIKKRYNLKYVHKTFYVRTRYIVINFLLKGVTGATPVGGGGWSVCARYAPAMRPLCAAIGIHRPGGDLSLPLNC